MYLLKRLIMGTEIETGNGTGTNETEVRKGGRPFIRRLRHAWYRLQATVYRVDDFLGPYIKYIIPNFTIAHYVYILTWVLSCAIVLYAGGNMSFANAIFFGSATATQSGLNTIDLNTLYLYQQIFLYITCILTSNIFVHSSVAFVRLYWYEKKFHNIKQTSMSNFKSNRARTIAALTEISRVNTIMNGGANNHQPFGKDDETSLDNERGANIISFGELPKPKKRGIQPSDVLMSINMMQNKQDELHSIDSGPALHVRGPNGEEYEGGDANDEEEVPSYHLGRSTTNATSIKDYQRKRKGDYLSWNPTIGNNSMFVTMNDEQKEELGGVEYRAMKMLCVILFCYYWGLHSLGCILLVPVGYMNKTYKSVLKGDEITPAWWAVFLSMSATTNLGYALTPDSLVAMDNSPYVLLVVSALIYFGNSGFPVTLRCVIWICRKFSSPLTMRHQSLSFLLDHPRRCFTMLFPGPASLWLFIALWSISLSYWILFIILDINRDQFAYMGKGYVVVNGFFQAITSRTAGLASFSMGIMNPCIQMLTVIVMYIALLPIAMSVRSTNVYEEQSLGIFNDVDANNNVMSKKDWNHEILKVNIRNQLSFDMWFLGIIVSLICICEAGSIDKGLFGIFDIIFEVISGYGTVGLSMGFTNINSSLVTKFSNVSKLLVCLVMIRGRHRGLPISLDRSIMINEKEMNLNDDIGTRNVLRKVESHRSPQLAEEIAKDDDDVEEIRENDNETRSEVSVFGKIKHVAVVTVKLVLHFVWNIFVFS